MHPILLKSFGGLTRRYYFRQLFFGLLFPALFYFAIGTTKHSPPISIPIILMLTVNTLLYPYSRFVYENVMDFIIGENAFSMDAILAMALKITTMTMCWGLAIFIAPIGLVYLYFRHSNR